VASFAALRRKTLARSRRREQGASDGGKRPANFPFVPVHRSGTAIIVVNFDPPVFANREP
jgi:hypothetical protein